MAPILEELISRLLLVFTKRNLIIFLCSCVILSMVFFIRESSIKFYLFVFISLLFSIILVFFTSCHLFFIKNFKIIFYLSAILFGLVHIFNFNGINISNVVLTPLIIIPQVVMGFLFGYLRVTYGFIYAVICHAFINFPILFSFIN